MALSDINERRGPWSCEGSTPSVGECQDREVRVDGIVSRGGLDRGFSERKQGKGITFEM